MKKIVKIALIIGFVTVVSNILSATEPIIDGSCCPMSGWVCGLNGSNYQNMMYVKP